MKGENAVDRKSWRWFVLLVNIIIDDIIFFQSARNNFSTRPIISGWKKKAWF